MPRRPGTYSTRCEISPWASSVRAETANESKAWRCCDRVSHFYVSFPFSCPWPSVRESFLLPGSVVGINSPFSKRPTTSTRMYNNERQALLEKVPDLNLLL